MSGVRQERKINPGRCAWVMAMILSLLPWSAHSQVNNSALQRIIDEGIAQIRNKQFDAAFATFEEALLVDPDNAEANFRIGQLYLQRRQPGEGLRHILKSTKLDPDNAGYSLYLGRLYERQGELQKAFDEYKRLLATGSNHPKVKEIEKQQALLSGRMMVKNNELKAALLIFNGLLLDYPDDDEVLYNLGVAQLMAGDLEAAEKTFLRLAKLKPNTVSVHVNLASIYERTKRREEAIAHYEKIIALNKTPGSVKEATIKRDLLLARKQLDAGQFEAASALYDKVLSRDPKRVEALFNKALALLNLGDWRSAEQLFLQVIAIKPKDFLTRLNLGGLYLDTRRYDKAKEQFQFIIDNDASGVFSKQAKIRMNVVHMQIADNALKAGNVEESLRQYQKALDFYSGNIKASFNRGLLLVQQRKFEQARAEFENVVRLAPDNMGGRINLANIYEQLGMFDEAARQYEKIMELKPDSPEAVTAKRRWRISKARALWADKRLSDAEQLLETIIREEPDNFEAYLYLGIIQSSKGKSRQAAKSFQTVLNVMPSNQAVRLSLAKVYEQLGMDNLAAQEYRIIIFSGAPPVVLDDARRRLNIVESRLSGFSKNLSYQMQYDNNLNLNDANPIGELRTDLAFNIVYGYKFRQDLLFNLSWSPTYSNYHLTQIDYLSSVFNTSLRSGTPEDNWLVQYGRQDQKSLITEQRVSESNSLNIGRSAKLFLPAFLGLAPKGFDSKEGVPTSLAGFVALRNITSFGAFPLDALSASLALNSSQTLRGGVSASLGYSLSVFRSLVNREVVQRQFVVDPISGQQSDTPVTTLLYDSRDYEYNSYALNVTLAKTLAPGLRGSLGGVVSYSGYINVDSGARTRGEPVTRRNNLFSLNLGVTYEFFKDITLVARLSWARNRSNLPAGLIRGVDEAEQAIASLQSTSLGDYTRMTATLGFSMRF